jgi:phospholipid transport system substrate-binding protein
MERPVPLLASRRVFLVAAFALFAAPALVAAPALIAAPAMAAGDPAQLIQTVADEVIQIIKQAKGAEREAAIQKILTDNFDMAYMGRAALATHWEATSEPERERYLKAVASAEAHAYSERFGQYAGQTLAVGRVTARPNGVSLVDSKLNQSDGPPISILWEVRDTGQGLRITDVKVEGVSMVMTRRSDFNSYIQGHGGQVEALIQELERRAKN